jgi:hypothetical protein
MPKRLRHDDSLNTKHSQKNFEQHVLADLDSEGAAFKRTTELPILPHQATAAFSDFIPMNDVTLDRTQDLAHSTSTRSTPTNIIEPPGRPTCFRVSGIPLYWSIDYLKKQVEVIDPNLNFSDVDLSGPFPSCCDSTQMASLSTPRAVHGKRHRRPGMVK